MAWDPLPRTGGTVSEFFEAQSAGWSLWSFTAPDDDRSPTAGACSIKHEHVDALPCTTGGAEAEQPAPFQEPWFRHHAEDIFLSPLFSDDEMRRMDGEAPDMFPDSMNVLVSSYENMLTGVLTGSEEPGDHLKQLDRDGLVDTIMDTTCGLQNGSRDAGQSGCIPQMLLAAGPSSEEEQAGLQITTKRSRAVAGMESTPGFEGMVLEELEDVVFQLTRRTRIRYRDAFYRLAESSRACHSSSQQADGNASSRFPPAPGCPERETNPIDRTVMVLTMKAPRRQLQLHGSSTAAEDSGTATSWAA